MIIGTFSRFSRVGHGRIASAVGAGRALPRRTPYTSSGFRRLQSLFIHTSRNRTRSQYLFRIDPSRTYFTSRVVMSALDRGSRAVLSKFGAYVRQRARTSIRRRKGISIAGMPPSSHTGLLKRGIFFGYDVDRRSVVIGPVPLASRFPEAPPALEYGGVSTVKTGGLWVSKYIRKRPFMGPALRAELPGLPAMWRNSVKA